MDQQQPGTRTRKGLKEQPPVTRFSKQATFSTVQPLPVLKPTVEPLIRSVHLGNTLRDNTRVNFTSPLSVSQPNHGNLTEDGRSGLHQS